MKLEIDQRHLSLTRLSANACAAEKTLDRMRSIEGFAIEIGSPDRRQDFIDLVNANKRSLGINLAQHRVYYKRHCRKMGIEPLKCFTKY